MQCYIIGVAFFYEQNLILSPLKIEKIIQFKITIRLLQVLFL